MKMLFVILLFLPALAFAQPSKDCTVTGAGQLCVERSNVPATSTLEMSKSEGCYRLFGECTKLPDGKCGWKDKGSLAQCLKDPDAFKPQMDSGKQAIPEKIDAPIKTGQ